jgi:2,5-furandicarboxylate decarboxylase 1
MPHTLRSFLESVDNRMLHIHDAVDPLSQVGHLCSESAGPLMFHNLVGFPGWRLTDILIKDRAGQSAAFGLDDPAGVCPYLAGKMVTERGRSVMVDDAPVQAEKMLGADINLHKLPIPMHSKGDGGRYLGSGITITKDPETGLRNEAIIRMMLTEDPQKATFWMAARHNYAHYLKYVERDEPMPMAFVIGLHPVYEIMSNWSGRHDDFDELEFGAGILGEDIELVKCETIDMEVPAHAEVVIEGLVHPHDRVPEGPFGEFTIFGSGAEGPAPVYQITGITHRTEPIFRHMQATWFTDHQPLITLPMEAAYYNRLKETHGASNILDVFVPPWASQFLMIVQMEAKWDGQVRDVLMSALSGPNLHVKIAVAVDADVDIYNAEDVLWAITCRVDPAQEVHIVPGTRLHPLDISIPQVRDDYTVMRIGGKMAIDATKPATWRAKERARFARVDPMGKGDPDMASLLEQVRQKR